MKYFVVFYFALITISVHAQRISFVGIPSSKMDYVASTQKKPQWCWAASSQMVLNYYKVAITQSQIVERTYGKDMYGNLPDWAATLETIHLVLNNLSVDNRGNQYIVNAQFGKGTPEPLFLIDELSQQRPVIIAYQSNTGGHVVVVTAVSYTESDFGPVIKSFIVRDPKPTEENKLAHGKVEFDAATLSNRITAYWFIRVMVAN